MTTLRFLTIWDQPLASRRDPSEVETDAAPLTERFLTIWDSPRPRQAKSNASKRAARKLPKFYL
ncbi:hypothetical protein [Halomonas sp. A29]|uniref:hypothetical protein n=1 Tax=Halomonas sp. A29 TaxID=3102786 RepID=UPI00398B1D9C